MYFWTKSCSTKLQCNYLQLPHILLIDYLQLLLSLPFHTLSWLIKLMIFSFSIFLDVPVFLCYTHINFISLTLDLKNVFSRLFSVTQKTINVYLPAGIYLFPRMSYLISIGFLILICFLNPHIPSKMLISILLYIPTYHHPCSQHLHIQFLALLSSWSLLT